jgi:hypothetical protein
VIPEKEENMERIQFDSGVRSYRINGSGILRFNPGDPNLYARFLEATGKLQALESELIQQAEAAREGDILKLMACTDEKMKEILNWVFGADNDFHKILNGVNLLAVAENGERVVTNLFSALEPVLLEGAKRCAGQQAAQIKAKRSSRV